MRSGLIAAQALSLLFFTGVATAQDINETRTKFDSPAPADLLRRWNCRATVLGNYLYIDGGELGELVDGKATSFPNNSTLSIDLSKSWLTSSVEIRANGKPVKDGPLSMGYEAIWNDPTGSAFYTWGGYTTRGVRPAAITKEGIWKFTVDGKGGGAWLLEEPSNPQVLKTLKYAEDGAYTATNTTGFWYGGFSGSTTDPSQTVDQAVPGLVSYDMTRQTWRNDSALALSPPNGTARGAKAEYVPRFGPNGIVMILGGLSYSPFGNPGRDSGGLDFGNLTFFDPVTRNIYWQTTTGTVPAARWRYCSVGIDGGNGTYEIFIFGGQTADKNLALDDVYVLSLPGFVWTKAAATSPGQPRSQHTCVVVGKRQLLVVGGANYNIPSGRWQDPDPFPQGLGLFDMTDLTWSKEGQYKADAEPYQSPNAVKDWYSKTDLSTLSWSSSEVKELFVTASGAVVPASRWPVDLQSRVSLHS
ncbi:hypothetical protein B0T26DRAFT_643998 [Lasiosphaeria miniovina]|uniref:Kelch repeat-containing protein n=1 Tax=Lasiosphaeria miniovina TaxID=1954250 RepID=A0AA40AX23_9PEZI|nr:uncharacterized protein B0T26DRAFT_643998 [Lasiosphaeria miniovina]KAK0723587.1 hypothetical protein B0T26DRAFT_643998 [Lasiosphaeria miniovina]